MLSATPERQAELEQIAKKLGIPLKSGGDYSPRELACRTLCVYLDPRTWLQSLLPDRKQRK